MISFRNNSLPKCSHPLSNWQKTHYDVLVHSFCLACAFKEWAHSKLPDGVTYILRDIGQRAKRYPTLFAGFLLLMLLTFSGVLPSLLLVVGASLLSAGGLMLVSPELKKFLDPAQWKTTLRMLVHVLPREHDGGCEEGYGQQRKVV